MSFENPNLLQLQNSILKYHWGIPGGISAKLGYHQEQQPEAELWIGAHPKAPSVISAPQTLAGTTLCEFENSSGIKIPYLLKMLAVAAPLSIQAHPTVQQAAAGYDAETAAGIPLQAAHRNYRDRNSKPELIVSLAAGFQALCGFRSPQESCQLLRALCDTALAVSPAEHKAAAKVQNFCDMLSSESLQNTVLWVLNTTTTEQADKTKTELLAALKKLAEIVAAVPQVRDATTDTALLKLHNLAQLIVELSAAYPQDRGILVAVLLNQVQLRHGQALWLPPGTAHAYLRGYGVEIMSSSDNVLRGGLTGKHIDAAELAKVLNFKHGSTHPFTPVVIGSNYRYNPDPQGEHATPFELVRVVSECSITSDTPLSVLIVSGSFELTTAASENTTITASATVHTAKKAKLNSHASPVLAQRGDSYLIPAGTLQLRGSGEAYVAGGALTQVTAGAIRPAAAPHNPNQQEPRDGR